MSPLCVVVDIRISLFVRVVVTASVQLLLVLAAAYGNPRCWVKAVVADLNRLAGTTSKSKDYVGASCAEWVALIRASPSSFNKLKDYVFILPVVNDVNFWGININKTPSAPDALLEWYTCANCTYTCPTIQGLNWHMYHTHSLRQPDRALLYGTSCMACLQEYWTRERLVTHVTKSSRRCRTVYRLFNNRMSDEALENAEEVARVHTKDLLASGSHRAHAALPVYRLSGPLVEAAVDLGINFYSLFKKPPQRAPAVFELWPASDFYPHEV